MPVGRKEDGCKVWEGKDELGPARTSWNSQGQSGTHVSLTETCDSVLSLQGSDFQDASALLKSWCTRHRKLLTNLTKESEKPKKLWAKLLPQEV